MSEELATGRERLDHGVVHIFWFATDLSPMCLDRLEVLLDVDERARAARYRFTRDRRRFIATRGRLRTVLGRYTGREPAGLEFDTGPYGKPELRPTNGGVRLQFSVSRSDNVGVMVIGLGEDLGIDVEQVRPFDDALAIAKRMFTDTEHRTLCMLPDGARPAAFFSYWTRKEAVVKSLGRGLAYPLDAFGLSSVGRSAECLDLECEGASTVRWVLPVPSLREGFVAALAASGQPPVVRCWTWPGE